MRTATPVPDGLWELIEPLLPAPIPRPRGGRPRLSDRTCLTGIVFVLRSRLRLWGTGHRYHWTP